MPKAGGWLAAGDSDFTFDPTSLVGQVRLLTNESDAATAMFGDAEISGYLALNASDVRIAAAQLLDVKAVWYAQQGKQRMGGQGQTDESDYGGTAKQLAAQAAELRRQAFEDGEDSAAFDVIEMVTNPFGFRERLYDEALRQG